MPARRSRDDGGLFWSESRQRWIAEITVGYRPNGKRITRKASAKTKTDAKDKLKEMQRDHDDGLPSGPANYTVADAVNSWLSFGLSGRDPETVKNYTTLANRHIVEKLGRRKLRELSAEDVDKWLAEVARLVSTRTVRLLHSILSRAVRHGTVRRAV